MVIAPREHVADPMRTYCVECQTYYLLEREPSDPPKFPQLEVMQWNRT